MIELEHFPHKNKVREIDGCWLWQGAMQHNGYGRVYDRRTKCSRPAHRVVWEETYGPITGGHHVDHICHTKTCVRPTHLRLTNIKQNQENRSGAQRNSKSGVRGVHWYSRRNKWRAQIGHNGKLITVGLFDTIEAATYAVISKRNELFTHNEKDKQ